MLSNQKQDIAALILEEIQSMLDEADGEKKAISKNDELNAHLGLGSLDLAQLVAMLEIQLEADPFAAQTPITRIRTVGDLIAAYEEFLSDEPNDEPDSEKSGVSAGLLAAQQRAASRRNR